MLAGDSKSNYVKTMLKSFLSRLNGDTSEPASADDERTAVAALLVHVARIDDDYTSEEQGLIEAILMHRYDVDAAASASLRREGEQADDASVDAFRFTQAVRGSLAVEQRIPVIEALWSVVLSDGRKDVEESELIRRVVKMLDLDVRDSVHARQRIEQAMKD